MSPDVAAFVNSGAGAGLTLAANRHAFETRQLIPQMAADTIGSPRQVIGPFALPHGFLLAPAGALGAVHPDGEAGVARAAQATGTPTVVACTASDTFENIADQLGDTLWWAQIYPPAEADLRRSLVKRATAAGAQAIVVTLDAPQLGWRPAELDHGWQGRTGAIANYLADPVFRSHLKPDDDPIALWKTLAIAPFTWQDIADLCTETTVPVLAKGILCAEDARHARQAGCAGIIVSNHGGRHLDGVVSALDALETITQTGEDYGFILMDSGIRTGSDVLKARVLGADGVLVGRPWIWGLALAGEQGVRETVEHLQADIERSWNIAGGMTVKLTH
jgi:isopentenyl diphosphate isomerase/L-lactate dehydrogenase-like FMN-dependent dehydrogenase